MAADPLTPVRRKRLGLMLLVAAVGLAVLIWQRLPPSPRALRAERLAAAERRAESGNLPAAVRDLRAVIVADPGAAEAYAALGGAYLTARQYESAVQPLEMAASLAPGLPHIRCRLADAYLHVRDRDAAVRAIEAASKSEPECARARLVAGEQWLRDDDLTRALAEFREAGRLAPDSPLPFQRAGYILLELDRPDEAEKILHEGLRAGPDDIGLHVQLGRLYALRSSNPEDLARAKSHYLRAVPGNPNAATVRASLGELARLQGKTQEAEGWWEAALKDNPREMKALYGLGQMRLAAGDKAEGQALLKRYSTAQKFQREVSALRMQATTRPTRELRLRFARLALDSGQADEAERQLTALLREHPADPVIRNLQGDLYLLQQRPEDAQREYRLASALPREPAH